MIRARALEKIYTRPGTLPERSTVRVLDGVDLDVACGDFVAVTGASGAGKSTLLQILGCLDQPTAGRYELEGRNVTCLDDAELAALRNRALGFVFQSSHFIDYLDLVDNVALPALYAPHYGRMEARARALDLLERVGLAARVAHLPAELSGGERQRAALARALLHSPRLVLADEPTGNLDDENSVRLVELLAALCEQGAAVLLVTHDTRLASVARSRYRLEHGRLEPC